MAKYTKEQLVQLLRKAGIPEKDIPMMVAIALAESAGNSDAQGDQKLADNKWGNSVGLFQVRSLRDPSKYKGADALRDATKLEDPIFNAKAAWAISKQGKDFTPWTTFNEGTYLDYMNDSTTPSRSRGPKVIKGKGKVIGELNLPSSQKDINIDTENTIDLSFLQTIANLSGLDYLITGLNDGTVTTQEALTAISASRWFKNSFIQKREALALQKQDPATFKNNLKNIESEIKQAFIEAGVDVNENLKQIKKLAGKAIFFDLTQEDFIKIVANSVDFESNYLKGLANTYAMDIIKRGQSFGVTLANQSAELKRFVKAKFTGEMSDDDINNFFKQEAIKAFPNYKARFDAGATLEDVADPFKKEIADYLELDVKDVNYNDPALKGIMTATNPKDGSPYAMSASERLKLIQNDPRYDKTKRSQNELVGSLLNMVGGRF